jgi:DNA replication protein DnaC
VLFATAAEWVARLAEAHAAGRLQAELARVGRYPLIVVDEVGYIPFEAEPPTCSSNWCRPATSGPA